MMWVDHMLDHMPDHVLNHVIIGLVTTELQRLTASSNMSAIMRAITILPLF